MTTEDNGKVEPIDMDESSERIEGAEVTRRPPLWSAIAVLLLPFVPTAIAIGAYRWGLSHGCLADGSGPCVVSGYDLGDIIQLSMAAAWLVVFGVWAPVLMATSIVHRAMDGFAPRLAMGGLLPAAVIIGSVIAPTIAAAILKPDSCSLQAIDTHCRVFGDNMQEAFALAGIQPWPMFLIAIPAAAYILIYMIVLGFDKLAESRRRFLAIRAAEAAARQLGQPALSPAEALKRPARPRKPLVYVPKQRARPPV